MNLRLLSRCTLCALSVSMHAQAKPTVLITAGTESVTSTSSAGAAVSAGRVAVGSGASNVTNSEHTELWEVVRQFTEGCTTSTYVTNPETPHTLTIRVDYERMPNILGGHYYLYQAVLVDSAGNPLYIAKKGVLSHEVKPVCKAIEHLVKSAPTH